MLIHIANLLASYSRNLTLEFSLGNSPNFGQTKLEFLSGKLSIGYSASKSNQINPCLPVDLNTAR